MAVVHFIQTIWSKNILDSLELKVKLWNNCLLTYEGDCKQASTVKILGVGEPTVKAYDKNVGIDPEAMSDAGQDLVIDQATAFAFLVDDIDKAQSVPGLAEEYQRKAVHKLAIARDSYIAGLIRSVTDNVTTAASDSPEDILEAIDDGIVALRERNFDEEGVIEVTPKVYNRIKKILTELSTNNPEYIKTGKVGEYDGFEVMVSNNMAKDSTHAYCDVRGKKAIAGAGQINEVEAFRHHTKFADVVRGLDTFGAKVIDKARIQVIKVPV